MAISARSGRLDAADQAAETSPLHAGAPLDTTPARGAATSRDSDWAAAAADTVERVVGSVRAKTADPLERIVRVVVYGFLAAIVGGAAAVLFSVLLLRGLVILTGLVLPDPEAWLAHIFLGAIFVVVGLLLWRRRTVKTAKV